MDSLCSAEIYGVKVMAPCDPVGFLNREYGSMEIWAKPEAKNYTWLTLDTNFTLWDVEYEWPRAFRYYLNNGSVDVVSTLSYLNEHAKNLNLTQLPDDKAVN